MNPIDFSQFGQFAIVFVLMATAVIFLYREWKSEKAKADESQALRLSEAKEARDKTAEINEKTLTLSQQIYDFLINNLRKK